MDLYKDNDLPTGRTPYLKSLYIMQPGHRSSKTNQLRLISARSLEDLSGEGKSPAGNLSAAVQYRFRKADKAPLRDRCNNAVVTEMGK
jgi:hypothetical protein